MRTPKDDPWLTIDEVSRRLDIPRKTLLDWKYKRTEPRIPWAKFGSPPRNAT